MAFQIKYTRLFECRIWHGYYLHQGNRQNFYNYNPNVDADLTNIKHILSRYDLKNFFDLILLGDTKSKMAGRKMKLVQDNTGFFVGVSVVPTTDLLFYQPTIPIEDGLKLQFGLRLANPNFFAQVTNERLQPNVPAIYYFSNLLADDSDYADSGLTTISQQYPDYQNRRYEMGEMITDGTTLFRSYEPDYTGVGLVDISVWEAPPPPAPLPNNNFDNRFEVNSGDRVLLPTQFNYTITPQDVVVVNTVDIELHDLGGGVLQSDSFTLEPGQTQLPLNYSDIGTGWYLLVVNDGSGDYTTSQRIYINDELFDQNLWGVIEIGHDENLSTSSSIRRLLESDGSLRHTLTESETPVFNIRIPNRYTYWRYKPHPLQTPLTPVVNTEFIAIDDLLVSINQQPNTQFGVQINYEDQPSGNIIPLPSPVVDICRPETDGKIYSDVHLGLIPI